MTRARGEGSVYRRRSDGRWVAALRWPNGKLKVRYRKTQRAAAVALIELHALRREGRPVPDDLLTLSQWLDRWFQNRVSKLAPNTQRRYRELVDGYVRPTEGRLAAVSLGRAKLLTLSVAQVSAWLASLLELDVTPPTADHSLIVLRAALTAAMREDLIVRNPASLVEAPKYRRKKGKPLTQDEATDLLGAIRSHRLYALIVLALTSGLRRGELLGLTWGAVHEGEAYLHVLQQAQRDKGKGILLVPTKTERSEAPVALTRLFLGVLRQHRAKLIEERMTMGPLWKGHDNPVAPEALVFPSRHGTPMDGGNTWREWRDILVKAGIEHRRIHDSRHTTATILRALGVEPEVVQAILRHTRYTTTAGYVHTDLTQQRAAMEALDELLGGVLG